MSKISDSSRDNNKLDSLISMTSIQTNYKKNINDTLFCAVDYEDDEADYEYDKEKEIDEFLDWFHDLMGDLSLAERNEIFTGPLAMELNDYGASPDEFEVKIPTEIVEMAK